MQTIECKIKEFVYSVEELESAPQIQIVSEEVRKKVFEKQTDRR